MAISDYSAEILVTISHSIFVWGCWFLGRLFYVPYSGCKLGVFGCPFAEPVGLLFAFLGSVLYFHITRHVLNFLYKGKLPDGEDLSTIINKFTKGKTQKVKK
jgi:Na+-driven multidrug efflux pump